MNCRRLYPDKRMCGQYNCTEPASCLTRISGFDVTACKKHHACDHSDKSIPKEKDVQGSGSNNGRKYARGKSRI